jgi:hypothetical protein
MCLEVEETEEVLLEALLEAGGAIIHEFRRLPLGGFLGKNKSFILLLGRGRSGRGGSITPRLCKRDSPTIEH